LFVCIPDKWFEKIDVAYQYAADLMALFRDLIGPMAKDDLKYANRKVVVPFTKKIPI
jgi:hypothetical protein